MNNNLSKQYNGTPAKTMEKLFKSLSKSSTNHFRKILNLKNLKGNLLDIGFGEGTDLVFYEKKGFKTYGIDPSIDFNNIVKEKTKSILKKESSEKTSFKNNFFDVVVSKYTLQTLVGFSKTYKEISRILKKDGTFQFLIVHPMRQYFEKKDISADYFKKEIVYSNIFDNHFTVLEPSHTLQEILSKDFLNMFTIETLEEGYDFPASEQVDGRCYPTYLIIRARKK